MSELVAHDANQTIAAGGIAALGAKLAQVGIDHKTSTVTARTYRHPALEPGKVIVRLEPDAIAIGTDAEMAAFGFEGPTVSKPLGQVRSRTLGFPAWALVHDPKRAKAALDVTDDMRKAKRLVAAKPGHAKDAFEKIAKQLQRTAPQFLPSFWEEVGRVVADQASTTMAAQCFERARQAERAFKLKTDPDDADAVFVEFALLGALSAKTLTAYAKDLTTTAGGAEAYRRFRAITLKRALGGMPPYSGMGKDLRALAVAAKLDPDAEADNLFADLIDAPGIGRAPAEFWTTYRDSFVRLGTSRDTVRSRLRSIWPWPRGGSDESRAAFRQTWMQQLDAIGAFANVPEDGLGGWVSKMIAFAGKQPIVEAVLRREAPRLVAGNCKIAVVAPGEYGSDLNLDLAELALSLGVALADPDEYEDFDLDTMTADPVRLAEHPVYGKKLVEATANMMGNAEYEHRMAGKAGFVAARRRWIEERIAQLDGRPVPAAVESLTMLDNKTTPETFLSFQDLHARLAAVDLSTTLAVQLRTGIADEFGWPAYEQAVGALGTPVKIGGAFPILTAWNAVKAIAMGHTGVIAEHDVYKPKQHELQAVWFFDGQFLVELQNKSYDTVTYWSSKPKDKLDKCGSPGMWGTLPNQWSPPSGGVTTGSKRFVACDTFIGSRNFITDGTSMWIEDNDKYFAFDPETGKKGKQDAPAWVADVRRDGWDTFAIWLPAPPGLKSSPLGMKDGMLGLRRLAKRDDWDDKFPVEHERIDGVKWKGSRAMFALATFPGDDAAHPINAAECGNPRFLGGQGQCIEIFTPTGELACVVNQDDWAARGWGVPVPPAPFWDFLTPRDEAGSAALRRITVEQARIVLGDAGDPARLDAAIRSTLGIRDSKLVRGIAGIVDKVAEITKRAAELAESRSKEHADPGGQGLLGAAAHMRKLATALAAGRATKLEDFEGDPREWLVYTRARVAMSLSPIVEDSMRRTVRSMVQAITGTIFAEDLSRIRLLSIEAPEDYDKNEWGTVVIQPHEGSVFAISTEEWAVELSTDGTFRVPPLEGTKQFWEVVSVIRPTRGIGTTWADRFLELPEQIAWDPAIAVELAKRADLSIPEAILLWINPIGLDTWQRDFLGKKHRELLGLKTTEATAARTTFEELPDDKLWELYERAVPDDAMQLAKPLAPGGFVERLASAWRAKFGKRAKIPQDLIAAATKEVEFADALGKMLPAFAGAADDATFLKVDPRHLFEMDSWSETHYFDEIRATEVATLVSWLFLFRPVGCAIRAGIVDVVDRIREVIDAPKLVWAFESLWIDDDDPKSKPKADRVIDAIGGKPIAMKYKGSDCEAARDDGTVIAAIHQNQLYAGFRPAKLDAKSRKKVEQLGALIFDPDMMVSDGLEGLRRLEHLRSDGFKAFAERVSETPVDAGGYEANPAASVPKLVAKVAKEKGISDAAAALYLQTLALSEPTQQRVQLWNDWKPKQYNEAAAQLVKKKLVVEGKRERAGRTIFIKGGYSKGDRKNLPMEEWKQPFYTLPRHLPVEPCHLLFARAWKRVEDGD